MDLSALIFVALAVAWGVYLIPKALTHHEEGAARRPVEAFSSRLRVLARRQPVDAKRAELVRPDGAPVRRPERAAAAESSPTPAPTTATKPVPMRVRRAAAAAATRRRRRVLGAILFFLADAVALAYVHVIPWAVVFAPAGLLLCWLVLCRVMVRREHAVVDRDRTARRQAPKARVADEAVDVEVAADDDPATEEIAVVPAGLAAMEVPSVPVAPAAPAAEGWDPVEVPLPTYVAKEAAVRRSVRTIDLDSTGVWTSGRTDADAALAREAEEARSESAGEAEREQRHA